MRDKGTNFEPNARATPVTALHRDPYPISLHVNAVRAMCGTVGVNEVGLGGSMSVLARYVFAIFGEVTELRSAPVRFEHQHPHD